MPRKASHIYTLMYRLTNLQTRASSLHLVSEAPIQLTGVGADLLCSDEAESLISEL